MCENVSQLFDKDETLFCDMLYLCFLNDELPGRKKQEAQGNRRR